MKTKTIRFDPGAAAGAVSGLDVTKLGARSGLLWAREGFVLAGIGSGLRIPLARPDGALQAQATLAGLAGSDEVNRPGSGPVAFGAFAFDPEIDGELVVPRIVVGSDGDGAYWLTTLGEVADPAAEIAAVLQRPVPAGPEPTDLRLSATLAPEIWRDEVVGFALDRIRAGDLSKAVLARELVLRSDHPIDQAQVLDRLCQAYPLAIVFNVEGFLGASPELLVSRHGEVVGAHPLAGTAPRKVDRKDDDAMAQGLLDSTKDRWEHRITIDWLLDNLLGFCSYVDAEPEPTVVTLANVHHLGTRVEGQLSTPAASVLELVATLHPTPALGGDPQDVALGLIERLERADRGRYGGPTGWVDGAGNGAFAVAVRSAQFGANSRGPSEIRLFAGGGIVADSDPAAELAETRSKFQAMLGALIRP